MMFDSLITPLSHSKNVTFQCLFGFITFLEIIIIFYNEFQKYPLVTYNTLTLIKWLKYPQDL